jgi:ribosomal protein L37E
MSEVIHNAPQEFWQPPVASSGPAAEALAGACERCGTEFMVGARFCHVCGASRAIKASSSTEHNWAQVLEFLKVLEFHRVKEWFALPTASLISFLIGVGCLLAAITVGIIYSVQNLADFQAIQLWRIEWLLAALAAFMAGILLKR